MNIVGILIRQVIIMFSLMFVGYVCYKRKIISDQGSADIGKLLLHVVIPVVVISNFWVERTPEKTQTLIYSFIIALIGMITAIVISCLVFHKSDRIAEFSTAFSNAGFIGIPLVQASLGSGAVFYISMMIVLINLLQWTYGVYTITDDKSVMDVRKVMKSPIVVSVIIGLAVYFTQIPMPSIISSLFTSISAINTPLAMFVSGVYLAQSELLKMLKRKNNYLVSAVRLLLLPVITLLVFKVLPFGSDELKMAILIAAACPVGSNVAIFAQQYNRDYREGVEHVCVSTLLSIVTLPLVVMLAEMMMG